MARPTRARVIDDIARLWVKKAEIVEVSSLISKKTIFTN